MNHSAREKECRQQQHVDQCDKTIRTLKKGDEYKLNQNQQGAQEG